MTRRQPTPLVGLPACVRERDGLGFHEAGDKYVRAVAQAAGAHPLVIPSLGDVVDVPDLVRQLDGLLMTGSPSNVHPERYGQPATEKAEPYDVARDATTFPLIEEALRQGLPLFAICRGFQELNVALGGTLHPAPARASRPRRPSPPQGPGPGRAIRTASQGLVERGRGLRHLARHRRARSQLPALARHRSACDVPGGRGRRGRWDHRGGSGRRVSGFRARRSMASGVCRHGPGERPQPGPLRGVRRGGVRARASSCRRQITRAAAMADRKCLKDNRYAFIACLICNSCIGTSGHSV